MFGRLFHWSFDLILISALLASIKRSTGLSPAISRIPNKDLRQLTNTYLELGEWAVDLTTCVYQCSALGRPRAVELLRAQALNTRPSAFIKVEVGGRAGERGEAETVVRFARR